MKTILTISLFFFFGTTFSQVSNYKYYCTKVSSLDKKIYDQDHNLRTGLFTKGTNENIGNTSIKSNVKSLALNLRVGESDFNLIGFRNSLSCIRNPETITWLEYYVDSLLSSHNQSTITNENQSLAVRQEMLSVIHDRTNELIKEKFTYYGFSASSKKWLKGIYIDHGNDLFAPYNDDRDLTGSLRIELFTDRLRLQLFDWPFLQSILNLNGRNWYSYQSIFIGGVGYTPYLRDTTIFNSSTAFDTLDRPYGSFTYFGRAQYRITRKGRCRTHSEFKIGTIGGDRPNAVQSLLHRDINTSSQKPNGWDAQIAAGGRLGLSYYYLAEFAATISPHAPWYIRGATAFGYGEIGHDKTYLGFGVGWHNLTLKERGGLGVNMTESPTRSNSRRDWFNSHFSIGLYARYHHVFHDAMLEGYGILKYVEDNDPNSTVNDKYRIKDSTRINRNIFTFQVSPTLRFKNVAIVYRLTISTSAFDLPVNMHKYKFAGGEEYPNKDDVKGNHNRSAWDHVGTLGLVFSL